MIELRPFRAWRPTADKAHLVGTRSFVSYTAQQLAEKLAGNPYTFLHVVHPDEGLTPDLTRSERFHRTRVAFKAFCDEDVVVRDPEPCIYIYEQTGRGNLSRGIITGVSVKAYQEGKVKVHEQTLTARETLFTEYLQHTGINAEPVLLTTPEGTGWESLLDPYLNTRPDHDFTTTDRVRHRLWAVADPKFREDLQRRFSELPALYIADGHHRMASSARLALTSGSTDVDPSAWCLAFIVPRSQLYIYNYDRAVTTMNGLSNEQLLNELSKVGELKQVSSPYAAPGIVAVRDQHNWYTLRLPISPESASPVSKLDAARLSELVLGPILGIHDLRTDPNIKFIPGINGTRALDEIVENGNAVLAFHLFPVSFDELKNVADTGGTMPPKSTYIEPKLRSGLTVYSLEDV
ncbi:MAG: DUF1015 domain-containing protein [Flavobacteriales bacterium]|nr:DUF1015 domain-containing protein [Flavobacteriales bacterium]